MTKRIPCRVIDSTALAQGDSDLHLGWCLNTKIYPHNSLQNLAPKTWKNQNHPNTDTSKTLDCYA
jgi:hypothetical protein